jgi:hypothetical protein
VNLLLEEKSMNSKENAGGGDAAKTNGAANSSVGPRPLRDTGIFHAVLAFVLYVPSLIVGTELALAMEKTIGLTTGGFHGGLARLNFSGGLGSSICACFGARRALRLLGRGEPSSGGRTLMAMASILIALLFLIWTALFGALGLPSLRWNPGAWGWL